MAERKDIRRGEAERETSQYTVPDDLAFPLVDSGESAEISYKQLLSGVGTPQNSPLPKEQVQTQLETAVEKMVRQSIHLRRANGQSKTTFEESRKTPPERKSIQDKLKRKYRVPKPAVVQTELSQFIISSRIIDPPPPCHDVGDFDVADLRELSSDPAVLDILKEDQRCVPQSALLSRDENPLQIRIARDPDEGTSIMHFVETPNPEE